MIWIFPHVSIAAFKKWVFWWYILALVLIIIVYGKNIWSESKVKTHYKTGYLTLFIDVTENSGSSFSLRFEFFRMSHTQKENILMMHTCSDANHCLWQNIWSESKVKNSIQNWFYNFVYYCWKNSGSSFSLWFQFSRLSHTQHSKSEYFDDAYLLWY